MTKTLTLYLVRHAESQNNALPEPQRVSDPSLTDLGLQQAVALGNRLQRQFESGNKPDTVLCSPFLRTLQTIQPTAQLTSTQPLIWTELFEAGGCYDGHLPGNRRAMPGMTRTQIESRFPEFIVPADIDDAGWYPLDGFEEWQAASERAGNITKRLISEFYGQQNIVLCMIHGDLIRLLLHHFCNGESVLSNTNVSNTSVTSLHFTGPASIPEVVMHNDASHLAPDEISH